MENGEVDGETMFHSRQIGFMVQATYEGGTVLFDTLVGKVGTDGNFNLRYQRLNRWGAFMTGECESRLEILENGRYRLHEPWRWTSGGRSSGSSVVEGVER